MENLKRKQVMTQKEKYKRAAKGDIAYNMMRMWQGALGPAPVDGLVSPAYVVASPFPEANSAYFSYLFRTEAYMREVNKYSHGIVADRNRLYWDEFKQMPSLVPPRPEQDQIVAYLRAQDFHIARLIKAKQELIGLLNEQKFKIIDGAVTRGIDASVRLKASGIEWLEEMPAHWQALKIKFVSKRIVGGSTPKSDEPTYWGGDVIWITPKDVSKTSLLNSSLRTITREGLRSCSTSLVPAGSIVITSRAPVGNVSIAQVELCTNQGCKAIIPAQRHITSQYLFTLLVGMKYRLQVLSNGTTFSEIGTSALANEFIPVPPVEEQNAICLWIECKCKPLSDVIQHADDEISLIREYRDRLISDVVTGRIDVRNWQPGPDDAIAEEDLAAIAGNGENDATPEKSEVGDE